MPDPIRAFIAAAKARCSPAAHPQMRQIAVPLLAEFKRLIPVVFDDLWETLKERNERL